MPNSLGLTAEEHHNHRVWNVVDECLTLIDSVDNSGDESQEVVESCSAVLGYLKGLRDSPSPIVTQLYLNELANAVDSTEASINNWLASPTPTAATSVQSAVEAVASLTRSYPITRDSFSYGIRSAFEAAATRAEERVVELEERIESQRAELTAVSEAGAAARDAATAALQRVEEDVNKLTTSAEAQLARVDTALTTQQEAFTTAQGSRQESFSATVAALKEEQADLRSAIEEESQASRTALDKAGQSILAEIAALKEHARKLVGAIGTAGSSGERKELCELL